MASHGPGRGRVVRTVLPDGRPVYRADYTDSAGKRHRQNLAGDRSTAEQMLSKLIRERDLELAGFAGERGTDLAIRDLVAQYMADLRTRAKPRTIANTEAILGRMLARMALVRIRDVTKARVSGWRIARLADGAAHKTVNTELGCLAAALNLAVRLDQIPTNPLDGLRALPTTAAHRKRRARALTEEEIERVLEAAQRLDVLTHDPIPREPLLRALIGTGARWNELVSTTWGDYDRKLLTLDLRGETTKTQVARRFPLDEAVVAALESLRTIHPSPLPSARIFLTPRGKPWTRDTSNFRRWFDRVLMLAGIPRFDHTGRVVHIHALRYTFASRLARHGVSLKAAQSLTGHRSATCLLDIYQQVTLDDARIAIRALPRLPGKRSF